MKYWQRAIFGNSAIMIYIGTAIISFITGLFQLTAAEADMKAELKYRDKYERVIIENINYRANCGE